ncbi:MAG: HAD-IC family P-type ATPase [Promicromonosporaceae bacterium]|nr:HAD-IC family P-type ATPase [Promicromonosporaceae bacterium]
MLAQLDVTAEQGLSGAAAARRLAEYGPNRLPEPKKMPWYLRLAGHLNDVIIFVLLAAAAIKTFLAIVYPAAGWADPIVIFGVVVLTVSIGMIQEGRAEKSLEAIKNLMSASALVLRDGQWQSVDAETLVPGDVIRVKAGDRMPADARLLDENNLQIEEAALTGESVAAEKTLAPLAADSGLGDRTNMLFSSTIAVAGTGTAVVTGTGADTEIGRIQDLMESATDEQTPLGRTMDAFGKKITIVVLVIAAVMGTFAFVAHQMNWMDLFSAAVGVAVAAVPEGLTAVVAIALALGVKALAHRNSVSRNLTSTETLGAITTICSDKTGTLTQNEMTVRVVRTAGHLYDVDGAGYKPVGAIHADGAEPNCCATTPPAELTALAEAFTHANDAIINPPSPTAENGLWTLTGEPTEGAVLVLGRKVGVATNGWSRVAEIPFDSKYKYMATLTDDPEGNRHLFVKGALGAVLSHCDRQIGVDGIEPLDPEFWRAEMEVLAARGLRVLAAARTDVDSTVTELPDAEVGPRSLIFTGIAGIVDPPRPEAIHSIAEAHAASIDVKMITGDHVITAKAIAQEMGITHGEVGALTGPELEAMSDEELQAVVRETHVFARVSPTHKIRIVRALQHHGEIVAMTGDGVNDAPALTQANVGVAMGVKGTEATKAAADLILLDDNFSTIEKAIYEGRRVFDNIRKCTMFALPANVAQTTGILLATFLGWQLADGTALAPLTPIMVLWVNMVVAVCLDLTFASEPAEDGIMRRRPRNVNEALVTVRYGRHIFLFGWVMAGAMIFMFLGEFHGWLPGAEAGYAPAAQSAALSMIMLAQTAHVFNVRRLNTHSFTWKVFRGNKALGISLAILAVAHGALMYFPPMTSAFGLAPTSLRQWAFIVPLAFAVFGMIELLKWLFKLGEDAADRKAAAKRELSALV